MSDLNLRKNLNRPLTWEEMDSNLEYLETMSGCTGCTGSDGLLTISNGSTILGTFSANESTTIDISTGVITESLLTITNDNEILGTFSTNENKSIDISSINNILDVITIEEDITLDNTYFNKFIIIDNANITITGNDSEFQIGSILKLYSEETINITPGAESTINGSTSNITKNNYFELIKIGSNKWITVPNGSYLNIDSE